METCWRRGETYIVGKVGVQAHTSADTDRPEKGVSPRRLSTSNSLNSHVGQQTEEESSQARDGGGSGDEISPDLVLAQQVVGVLHADGVLGREFTDTRAARVGDDAGVDGQDVRHGEEGDDAGADLGEEPGAEARLGLSRGVSVSPYGTGRDIAWCCTHVAGTVEAEPIADPAARHLVVEARDESHGCPTVKERLLMEWENVCRWERQCRLGYGKERHKWARCGNQTVREKGRGEEKVFEEGRREWRPDGEGSGSRVLRLPPPGAAPCRPIR